MTLSLALAFLAISGVCLLLAVVLAAIAIRAQNRMTAAHGGRSKV